MAESVADWFWGVVAFYGLAGVLFTVPFVTRWVGLLDASARTGSWGFRIIIVPGCVALWPVLARKTWRAWQGRYVPPVAEKPVAPARLRRIHERSFRILAVVVPVVCVAAMITRPPETPVSPDWSSGRIFPEMLSSEPVAGLPITVELRASGSDRQALLHVAQALAEPVVALYWSEAGATDNLPKDAVFVGSVWGPAELPMMLPAGAATNPGVVYFLSLSGEQRLLGTLALSTK